MYRKRQPRRGKRCDAQGGRNQGMKKPEKPRVAPVSSAEVGRNPPAGEHDRTPRTVPLSTTDGLPPSADGLELPEFRFGALVGRYLLLEKRGQGGMGVVYKGYDPELDRVVAIKLLRGSGPRSRLQREAQALAQLAHPNVVNVYDVGFHQGQVFLAMEFVEGQTFDRWLQKQSRSPRDILQMLLPAGEALRAAHQAGLVHRDFKPSNMIIGDDGRVRVLDFGLARAGIETASAIESPTPDVPTAETLPQTAALDVPLPPFHPAPAADPPSSGPKLLSAQMTVDGLTLGTPAYMAPEQIQGEVVDARADQFSFCVTAFEALYGRRPFQGSTSSEILKHVVAGRRVDVPRGRGIPAWLRDTLERGLAINPAARFPSMGALLDALAREPGGPRRRWLQRAMVVVAAAVLLAGSFALQQREEDRCLPPSDAFSGVWDEGVKTRLRAKVLRNGATSPVVGAWDRLESRLDDYTARWRVTYAQSCQDTYERHAYSEKMLELRMLCLQQRRSALQSLVHHIGVSASESVLSKALPAAYKLPRLEHCSDIEALRLATPLPRDSKARSQLKVLGRDLQEAQALIHLGDYDAAATVVASVQQRAPAVDALRILAEALALRGEIEHFRGEYARAEATLMRAIRLAGEARDAVLTAELWTSVLSLQAYDMARFDRVAFLAPVAESAVALAGDPLRARLLLANALGRVYSSAQEVGKARDAYQQAVELAEALYGADAPQVAGRLNNLAFAERRLGETLKARAHYRRAIELLERAYGPDHPDLTYPLSNIGELYLALGDLEQAKRHLDAALVLKRETLGSQHARVATTLYHLARWALLGGRVKQAMALVEDAYDIVEGAVGPDHWRTAAVLDVLAEVERARNNAPAARRHLERALEIRLALSGDESTLAARSRVRLGFLDLEEKRWAAAREHFAPAARVFEDKLGTQSPWLAESLLGLGEVARHVGDPNQAVMHLQQALHTLDGHPDPAHDRLRAATAFALAQALRASMAEQDRARVLAQRARKLYAALPGPEAQKRLAEVVAWLPGD